MNIDMNDFEVIRGNGDLVQILKFSMVYIIFTGAALGLKFLSEIL